MKKALVSLIITFSVFTTLSAQMWNGVDTLYGNEWIDFDQNYVKIQVAEDGIYRIPYSTLENLIPTGLDADDLQLFYLGEEIPLFTSTENVFGNGEYLEFFGRRNRTDLDKYLFKNPAHIIHPDFSYFTDTSAYFLSWSNDAHLRYSTETNDLTDLPAKEEYYFDTYIVNYTTRETKKSATIGAAKVQQSYFGEAEGFATGYTGDSLRSLTITPPGIQPTGPGAEMTVRFSCREGDHHQLVRVNGLQVVEDIFAGYKGRTHTFPLDMSSLSNPMTVEFEGIVGELDRQSVSQIDLTYPRTFNFSNQTQTVFYVQASPDKKYFEVTNFDADGIAPILYDVTNGLRMVTTLEGDVVKFALPPSVEDRTIVLVNASNGSYVIEEANEVEFIDYTQEEAQFIILYNQLLAIGNGGANYIEEYANYRATSPVQPLSTLPVNIQQVYDQFSYGINRHQVSVRNFTHFVHKHFSDPRYLFIVGKGREYRDMRRPDDVSDFLHVNFFVPTFGVPGSDNLFMSDNVSAKPIFPVGRLAAINPEEVKLYLEKVKTFEQYNNNPNQTIEDRAWMKRIMHLGGGGTVSEQVTIKDHLIGMENIIENNRFGGSVTSFYKTSSDPIENSQSLRLKNLINDGISILTFFGHSSANTFDFNFDDPTTYENFGKFPIVFSMGCFSGQCFTNNAGIGERFVLSDNRGAIAYFASTGYGFIAALNTFGKDYYRLIGEDMYGAAIGDILKEVVTNIDDSPIIGEAELAQQTILQGDPSLRLYPLDGPDYLVDPTKVSFDPALLNVQLDSFELKVTTANIGYHIPDTTFVLQIEQQLPGGTRETLIEESIPAPAFSEEIVLKLPMIKEGAVGLNRFFIKVDAQNDIEEAPIAAEFNNEVKDGSGELGIPIFIVSNDVIPVYPTEFSIVNDASPKLRASTANPFAIDQAFAIEIDTTAYFNSPLKRSTKIQQSGGVLDWTPDLPLLDETVYYWRVSPDSIDAVGYRWRESSFTYLPQKPNGWNQSHFFQIEKDEFVNMEILEGNRKLKFIDDVIDIKIQNCILDFPVRIPRYYRGGVSPASYQGGVSNAVKAGVFIAVLDTVDVLPILNPGGNIYGDDFSVVDYEAYVFKTDDINERAEVINFLENEIDPGNYVVFFTVQKTADLTYYPEDWASDEATLGTSLIKILEEQGATQVASLATSGSKPYSFFYRKDVPTYIPSETITEIGSITQQTSTVAGNWFSGSVISQPIGPASDWGSVNWSIEDFDPSMDEAEMRIRGIREDGSDSLLVQTLFSTDTTLAFINSDEYPYLELEFHAEDDSLKTSPHLDHWQVLYEGVPEAALNAQAFLELHSDTLQQGDPLLLKVAVSNLSDYDMDSLLVYYQIKDLANEEFLVDKRYAPLPAQEDLILDLDLDTRELAGWYELFIDLNPDEDQPEQTHFNNIGVLNFFVSRDQKNPLMDITFDGIRIMDGDLVSSKPTIVVTLEDENPFLELGDTSLFQLVLEYPDGTEQPISFQEEGVYFAPASTGNLGKKNRANIELSPTLNQDGLYALYVNAKDASGNESGNLNYTTENNGGFDYKISFRVINQSMISNILNYPNPFTTSTRFVYTLTGSEPPAYFKIQIMTVSGRVVRELTQNELGMLRIGTHRTDYAWDGTDQFGDPLAKGVYLYRIVAKKANGEDFDLYESGADGYVRKGFGKMVLLR
jgi:hypothetical protein